jgi:23S rRNA (pseudouridine1915-N3)-methyltransferase
MRLCVAAAGRLRAGPEASLIDDYSGRIAGLGRGLGVTAFDIREIEAPKGLSADKRRERESALLIEATPGARRFALDERGANLSSEEFARRIADLRDAGAGALAFLIGWADGHHPALEADFRIAFGRATFPHMLVRVMLVEQIYRALTILAGHPYHRA